MVKGEGLEVLHERMKTIDPEENVTYKFLGIEQADGIKTKEVFERIKTEVENRLELLIKTELNDRNLMKAINSKVIPVAEYPMNVCRFSKKELLELDQIIKRQLRKNNMLGRQSSDERLYLNSGDLRQGSSNNSVTNFVLGFPYIFQRETQPSFEDFLLVVSMILRRRSTTRF